MPEPIWELIPPMFPSGNQYNLVSLMGVALSLKTRFREMAGAHLGAHPSLTFPTENQYNLVSLMGVALSDFVMSFDVFLCTG